MRKKNDISRISESIYWCFARVNNRLAEIYFHKAKGISIIDGHCYVRLEEYTTKKEKKQIKDDTEKFRFSWKKGRYKLLKKY